MLGGMQDFELRVPRLIDFGAGGGDRVGFAGDLLNVGGQTGEFRPGLVLAQRGSRQTGSQCTDLIGHLLAQRLVAAQDDADAGDGLRLPPQGLGPPLQTGGDDGVGLALGV